MLGSDLTYKQFLFCEAYLRHFNVDKACREAYPNMKNSRNGANVLKSRKVQKYLRERLEQKKATIERLTDKMQEVIYDDMHSKDPQVRQEATKQAARISEIEAKLKQLEADQKKEEENPSTVINFNVLEREDEG